VTGRMLAICPICMGCGRTSINPLTGEQVPQPHFASNNTSDQGWTKCTRCNGNGVVPFDYPMTTGGYS
jgi:hypothetical protein